MVSIHAPVKGRPPAGCLKMSAARFNPRPREGATVAGQIFRPALSVSIHAPVKGRPAMSEEKRTKGWVSIHAPVKGRPW